MNETARPGPPERPTPESVLAGASAVLDAPAGGDLAAEAEALDRLHQRLSAALSTADRA